MARRRATWLIAADYDGTVAVTDTLDCLVDTHIGSRAREALDERIYAGELSFRAGTSLMFVGYRSTLQWSTKTIIDNALRQKGLKPETEHLSMTDGAAAVLDPGFPRFVTYCKAHDIPLVIVSGGLYPLITSVLGPLGIDVPVYANSLKVSGDGEWSIEWLDDSDYGHDKVSTIKRLKRDTGAEGVVYIGDGISDIPVARGDDLVDVLLVRRGRRLEEWCRDTGRDCVAFDDFGDVEREVARVMDSEPKLD